MTKEELKKIVAELEKQNEKEKAYFGFYQYGGGPDESCLKANRKGLELFSAELLKVAIKSDNFEFKENKIESISLEIDWTDENSHFYFDHVELTNKDKGPIGAFSHPKDTWRDKLFVISLIGMGILLIGLLIVGLITTVSWLI
jgi:hypothetical protein